MEEAVQTFVFVGFTPEVIRLWAAKRSDME